MRFLYTLTGDEADLDLARAELWVLTGCEAQGRLARGAVACDIRRATYVGLCAESLAVSESLTGLCRQVAATGLASDGFRVEVTKAPGVTHGSPDICCALAEVIGGSPDLSHPRERFLVACEEGSWELLRVLSASDRGHRQQVRRPINFSLALAARHARALVNLAAAPGDTLIDPCCGAGTCLIEALSIGIRAVGSDLSRANMYASDRNLRAFGYEQRVHAQDARTIEQEYDAAIIDFPYGHTTPVDPGLYAEILNNVAPKVFRLAIVMGEPADDLLASLGIPIVRCARVRTNSLVRHFYLLRGLRPA